MEMKKEFEKAVIIRGKGTYMDKRRKKYKNEYIIRDKDEEMETRIKGETRRN